MTTLLHSCQHWVLSLLASTMKESTKKKKLRHRYGLNSVPRKKVLTPNTS